MYEHIPEELKKLPHWVCWEAEQGEMENCVKCPLTPSQAAGR